MQRQLPQKVSAMKKLLLLACAACLLLPSLCMAEEKEFPWLMDPLSYNHLNNEQTQVYLGAFFETVSYALYLKHEQNLSDNGLAVFNACIKDTRGSELWSPNMAWYGDGYRSKEGAAFVLLHTILPRICESYSDRKGSQEHHPLVINPPQIWGTWPNDLKRAYLAGFLDTAAALQSGDPIELGSLRELIKSEGLQGLLADIQSVPFDPLRPLPWSMTTGIKSTRIAQR